MTERKPSRIKGIFKKLRNSGKTKDFLVFLVFVCIAAFFWFFMTLNDDVQNTFDVEVVIDDKPDSVTFISEVPSTFHVVVRDKGTNLLRYNLLGTPILHLRFQEYADGGKMRLTHNMLISAMRNLFGSSSTITSISPDSLSLLYTTLPGKELSVDIEYDVTVAPGMVLGVPKLLPGVVSFFSNSKNDTVKRISTEKIILRSIDRNTTVTVPVKKIDGKKVIPAEVKVTFVVEQLVKKESEVPVLPDNLPIGKDILFFPSKVMVTYYVPMSRYNDMETPIRVEASFDEAVASSSDKVGLRITQKAPYMSNVELLQDSVEYTLVKSN